MLIQFGQDLGDYLYDVFAGRIRFIMDAITSLVMHLPEGIIGTLSTAAAKSSNSCRTWSRRCFSCAASSSASA